MTLVFADAFYYLAILNPKDAAHQAAVAASLTYRGAMITSAWVLAEVADGTAAVNRRSRFVTLYTALTKDTGLIIVRPTWELFQAGIEFYSRHQDKDWSLTNCISFVVMRRAKTVDALTGDHHFEQAGFRALLK